MRQVDRDVSDSAAEVGPATPGGGLEEGGATGHGVPGAEDGCDGALSSSNRTRCGMVRRRSCGHVRGRGRPRDRASATVLRSPSM
jgi:hypothetical protein